jgi:hypothetical protein
MVGVGLDIWNEQQNDSPPPPKQDSHMMPVRPRVIQAPMQAPVVPPMYRGVPQGPVAGAQNWAQGPVTGAQTWAQGPVAPAVVSLGSDKSPSKNDNIFWMNIALVIIIILLVIIVFLLCATKKLLSKRNLTK